jgi:hypothetical protein
MSCALRIAASGGVEPIPWPADIPAEVSREAVSALVDEILTNCSDLKEAMLEVDCDEYPCAAYFVGPRKRVKECGRLDKTWYSARNANGKELTAFWFLPPDVKETSPEMDRRRVIRLDQAADLVE